MKIQTHESSGMWTGRRRKLRQILSVLAMGGLLSTVGCSLLSDGMMAPYSQSGSRLCTGLRGRATALSLWRSQYSSCYGNAANAKDIRRGFVDGFIETAAGGSGCTPLVPPTCCCGIGKRLNAKAWFQGYPLGVAAAQSSGASDWSKIAISPDLAACMATAECSPGCIPCSQNAGVIHNGMVHDQFHAPPAPVEIDEAPMFDDRDTIDDSLPPSDGSVEGDTREAVREGSNFDNRDSAEMRDAAAAEAIDRVEPLETPNAEPEVDSPSDRNAPAPLERSDDDLTGTTPAVQQRTDQLASTKEIPVARPTQNTPVVGQPITLPAMETDSQSSQSSPSEEAETFDTTAPVVGEPVELPNIQVSFGMEGVDWLFGEVDIAQAVLEQSVMRSLTE